MNGRGSHIWVNEFGYMGLYRIFMGYMDIKWKCLQVCPKLSTRTGTVFLSLHFSEKDVQRNSEQFPGGGALRTCF